MFSTKMFNVHYFCILSCFRLNGGAWLTAQFVFLMLSYIIVFHGILNLVWTSSIVHHMSFLVCAHTIHWINGCSPFAMCLWQWKCRLGTHIAMHNSFASIVHEVKFHVGWLLLYVFFSSTLKSHYAKMFEIYYFTYD